MCQSRVASVIVGASGPDQMVANCKLVDMSQVSFPVSASAMRVNPPVSFHC